MEHVSSATTLAVGTGLSANVDVALAAEQALEAAAAPAGFSRGAVDLALVFVSGDHAAHLPEAAAAVRSALEPGTLMGLTAEGVLAGETEIERAPAVAIFLASLPGTSVHPFLYRDLPHVKDGDEDALRETARVIGARRDLRATLFFADPFSVPASAAVATMGDVRKVVEGLRRAPVLGGMASGSAKPGGNTLVLNDQIMRAGGIGLAIRGDIEIDALVSQGCRPIGKPVVITGAQRNIIKTLGGQKALDALRDIISELDPADRELLPNGVMMGRVIDEYKPRFGRGDFLIRGVLGVDNTSGAIAVADLVRPGQTVQFHLRDARTATEDLELLLAAQQLQHPAAGALVFTCNGRGSRLFGEPGHDAGRIARSLAHENGKPLPIAGFFAAGEIGPVGDDSFLHGHTASAALFRQRRRIHG
ncbi:MAG: FIST N-terminal domain-containing protein, partial [Planctomycetota bacterium]|nr:FIST N-terminal domain-containing protein [Planctomycetota bacterium]